MSEGYHNEPIDIFAQIAEQPALLRQKLLVEPQPPALPQHYVPTAVSDPQARFQPQKKLDSAEALQEALAQLREHTQPFLQNLAPQPAQTRQRISLHEWDWRLQTEQDQANFSGTLAGAGEWQHVTLPHYGGPLGRATAYYRTSFVVTEEMRARGALFLCCKGIDYKAHVFVNGSYLGSHEGFFAPFEFVFTAHARLGENSVVIVVENDAICMGNTPWVQDGQLYEGDKLYAATGPGWDDPELGWHHCPPGMGIYQDVFVESRAPVHIHTLFVRPMLEQERAEAWVEVTNTALLRHPITLSFSLFGQNFPATLFRDTHATALNAGPGVNYLRLSFELPKPRIWDLDTPWLYQLQVTLLDADRTVLDGATQQFGMRSFTMDVEHKPYGRIYLNGREIRLRGTNTMGFEQQDVMRGDLEQLRDDILLAKLCHMNYWRLTQRPVQAEVYDLCDRLGLLTQTDLPLFAVLRRNQFVEALRQAEEMERLVRAHPCNILVSYINEPLPKDAHRHLTRPELERFFAAADHVVHLANPDRVIKAVDGDYDPPAPGLPDNHCYTAWYNGHGLDLGKLHKGYWQSVKPDWYYGCGEFGAEGLDPVNVMRSSYPPAWLPKTPEQEASWSPNLIPHAQTGRFHFMWFETPQTLAAWVAASQQHQAWATRLMTEAFRRDNRMVSTAIHLFIDAFPSSWMKVIMDVNRQPKPAYFAYREALTPLMVNLRTDRYAYWSGEDLLVEAWICNDTQHIPPAARLRYQLEVNNEIVFAQQTEAVIERCRSTFQGFIKLPAPSCEQRTTALLRLSLAKPEGTIIHDTALNLRIFPSTTLLRNEQDHNLVVLGEERGRAAQLVHELNLSAIITQNYGKGNSEQVIVIDDIEAYTRSQKVIDAAVEQGAAALFLELTPGQYEIGGTAVEVVACGMNPRHFVGRNTAHPLLSDFDAHDLFFWYDEQLGHPSPLLATTLRAPAWQPILLSGDGAWDSPEWHSFPAAAELYRGKGCYRICQVALAGRVKTNPPAHLFALRLLSTHPQFKGIQQ